MPASEVARAVRTRGATVERERVRGRRWRREGTPAGAVGNAKGKQGTMKREGKSENQTEKRE